MEQARGEDQPQQQEQLPTPLKCPRCNSLDTKFRYFNNHSLAQPRYYCKTCKRQWTVGGNLRNIPFGGKSRNGKQTKAASSRYGNQKSQPSQTPLPLGEEHRQTSQSLTAMAAIVPHDFDTTMYQPVKDLPTAGSPFSSYYFNDEISCLDAIQSLIQPEVINRYINAENQCGSGGANNASPSHFNNSLIQPTWPMNYLPQDMTNNFPFPTSDACSWNNFTGNTIDMEMDTTSVNVDDWLNFPGCSPP